MPSFDIIWKRPLPALQARRRSFFHAATVFVDTRRVGSDFRIGDLRNARVLWGPGASQQATTATLTPISQSVWNSLDGGVYVTYQFSVHTAAQFNAPGRQTGQLVIELGSESVSVGGPVNVFGDSPSLTAFHETAISGVSTVLQLGSCYFDAALTDEQIRNGYRFRIDWDVDTDRADAQLGLDEYEGGLYLLPAGEPGLYFLSGTSTFAEAGVYTFELLLTPRSPLYGSEVSARGTVTVGDPDANNIGLTITVTNGQLVAEGAAGAALTLTADVTVVPSGTSVATAGWSIIARGDTRSPEGRIVTLIYEFLTNGAALGSNDIGVVDNGGGSYTLSASIGPSAAGDFSDSGTWYVTASLLGVEVSQSADTDNDQLTWEFRLPEAAISPIGRTVLVNEELTGPIATLQITPTATPVGRFRVLLYLEANTGSPCTLEATGAPGEYSVLAPAGISSPTPVTQAFPIRAFRDQQQPPFHHAQGVVTFQAIAGTAASGVECTGAEYQYSGPAFNGTIATVSVSPYNANALGALISIDWGDESPLDVSTGRLVADSAGDSENPAVYNVTASHDFPVSENPDTFNATVTVVVGGLSDTANFSIEVA